MDAFVRQQDVQSYVDATAEKMSLSPVIVEKDLWVSWVLKLIFTSSIRDDVVFKGGTSLSKVYGLINRFSEDIDISISKDILGFGGDKSPEMAPSSKKTEKSLKEMGNKCSEFVRTVLKNELENAISRSLGQGVNWSLDVDPDDPGGQTLLFNYPAPSTPGAGYVKKIVKIECGSRSDQWPIEKKKIMPFIARYFSSAISSPEVLVHAMKAERTFWEKATILHAYAHLPERKPLPARQSRHYYDFFRLLESKVKKTALGDLDLLARVVEHKSIYFRSGWASYKTAIKGSLKISPPSHVANSLRADYRDMSEMFYGNVPEWSDIVAKLEEFESEFNSAET